MGSHEMAQANPVQQSIGALNDSVPGYLSCQSHTGVGQLRSERDHGACPAQHILGNAESRHEDHNGSIDPHVAAWIGEG